MTEGKAITIIRHKIEVYNLTVFEAMLLINSFAEYFLFHDHDFDKRASCGNDPT